MAAPFPRKSFSTAALALVSCQSKINFHFRWKTVIPFSRRIFTLFSSFFFGIERFRGQVYFYGKNKNRKFPIFIVHGNLKHVTHTPKGKLHTSFVDFRKAFDSNWHQGLLYKLLKYNISGTFYDTISSMYSR